MNDVIYEVDGAVYLDRVRRAKTLNDELLGGGSVDVVEWSGRMRAVLAEVERIPLVIGVRYRLKVFGGPLVLKHKHVVDADDGSFVKGVDVPDMATMEFVEIEGVYLGRHPDGPWRGLIALDIGGRTTALGDVDVQRVTEIRPDAAP